MKKVLVTFSVSLFISYAAAGKSSCQVECTSRDGACMQLGVRGRASALHLNEILNTALPQLASKWHASICNRHIKNLGAVVESAGEECVEWMDPYPGQLPQEGNGSASIIAGVIRGQTTVDAVMFDGTNSLDFSFFVHGKKHNGGPVKSLSRHSDGRLLIETADLCYSID